MPRARSTLAQPVGIVGDDAVDPRVDQASPCRRGSLTVHGSTLRPRACASRTRAGVRLRQNGDQIVAAGRLDEAGQRATVRRERKPGMPGRRAGVVGLHGVVLPPRWSGRRSAMSGAKRFDLDERAPVERLQRRAAGEAAPCARVDDEARECRGVDGLVRLIGESFVSRFRRTGRCRCGCAPARTGRSSAAMRSPSAGRCAGNAGIAARRVDAADVVALQFG